MNLVTFFIWTVLLFFAAKGFLRGLIREVCGLFALILGAWGASRFYPEVSSALAALIRLPRPVAVAVSFVLVFAVTALGFGLLGRFLTTLSSFALLGGANRVGGVAFGLLQGALVVSLLFYATTMGAVPAKLRSSVSASPLAAGFAACGADIVTGWSSVREASRGTATGRR